MQVRPGAGDPPPPGHERLRYLCERLVRVRHTRHLARADAPLHLLALLGLVLFYAVLLKLGFHDFYILGHQIGFVESIFLKGFPIVSDLAIFYVLTKFDSSKAGKMLAIFYLLNPLAIYVSSVWGQDQAGTIASWSWASSSSPGPEVIVRS